MNYSYYEIGGHVVTCDSPSPGVSLPPSTSISRRQMGAPAPLSVVAPSAPAGRNGFYELSLQALLGRSMVGIGSKILLTPDPLPVIDEIVGISLIVVGVTLTATAE